MLTALKLAAGIAAAVTAGSIALALGTGRDTTPTLAGPDLVTIGAGGFVHRPAGDYTRAGRPADAPAEVVRIDRPVSIMRHQVTGAEYAACVSAGACPPTRDAVAHPDHPAVQVSWRDATAYAAWLSTRTGRHYRLPTDAEWAYAAGSRFRDDALGADDPVKRRLVRYEREAAESGPDDATTRPVGTYGANEHGVLDLAGNVWEWTDTCFERVALDAEGRRTGTPTANCGVRVVEGRHRAYVTDFIRDARAGGCAAGIPPTHLGFRLVRDDGVASWWLRLTERIGG